MSFQKNSYEFSKQNKNSFIGNKRLSSTVNCHQYNNSQNDLIDLTSSDIERNKIHKNSFNNFYFEKNETSSFLFLNNEDRNFINNLNQNSQTSSSIRNNLNLKTSKDHYNNINESIFYNQQNNFNTNKFHDQINNIKESTVRDVNNNINRFLFQNENNNFNSNTFSNQNNSFKGISLDNQNNNLNGITFQNQNNNFNGITFQNQQITIHNQNISNNFNLHKCNNLNEIPKTNSKNDCFIDLTNTSNNNMTQINRDNRINLSMTKSQNSSQNNINQVLKERNIVDYHDSKKIYSESVYNSDVQKLLQTCIIPKLKDEQFYIYILKCESNKFYIGKTSDLKKRLEYHVLKGNCHWTKTYKPLCIEEIILSDDNFDEDKWVKKYMTLKGINNVRGGSYCQFRLSKFQLNSIVNEIVHSRGCCFYCFEDNHLVNTCRKKYSKQLNSRYLQILEKILTQGFSNNSKIPIFNKGFENPYEKNERISPYNEETDIIIDINNVDASNFDTEGIYEENSDIFLSE